MISDGKFRHEARPFRPDGLDLKIMSLLAEDGTIEYKRLAQKTGVDKRTVAKHVENLKKRSILKITANINWQAIGVGALAFVGAQHAVPGASAWHDFKIPSAARDVDLGNIPVAAAPVSLVPLLS